MIRRDRRGKAAVENWRSLERLQQVLLLALAAMFVCFTVVYPILNTRKGVAWRDTLLLCARAGENTVYTGRLWGREAVFTVSPGGVVSCMWDGIEGETYTVVPDGTAAPEDSFCPGRGVEIRRGDEVVFRGDWAPYTNVNDIVLRGGPYSEDMRLAVLLTQNPALTSRGVWALYGSGVGLSLLALALILLSGPLFQLKMALRVKDPYGVEPSEWELLSRRLLWIFLTGCALVCYVWGCTHVR